MPEPMRILVCGSRDWNDFARLDHHLSAYRPTILAHGGARGADLMAGIWASNRGIEVKVYPADWQRMGRGAGFARNQLMLDDFKPDLVAAFKDGFDHSLSRGGTEHMVKCARNANVATLIIDAELVGLFDESQG